MTKYGISSESEPGEIFTNSDNPKTPENEANDYEQQRNLRIAQNKAKLEALGLQRQAHSLFGSRHLKEKGKITQLRRSKRVSKTTKAVDDDNEDDEYKPDDDDDDGDDDDDDDDEDGSSEELEAEGSGSKKKKKVNKNKKKVGIFSQEDENVRSSRSNSKKVKNKRLKSDSQKSLQKSADIPDLMDEDEALKQAIPLSLNEIGETPNQRHNGSNQYSREDNTKKKKTFKNRMQMSEDDLVINFCQFDEVGKGSITLRDLQRMAPSHDFTWTDKELADMIRCFDSDRDGKLTLDDFRSIILRCNMLQVSENS